MSFPVGANNAGPRLVQVGIIP